MVDATKVRYGAEAALQLLRGIERLIVARGQKVEEMDLRHERPSDDELLRRLLGPTGNLRAPTARIGKVMIVGFHPDAYRRVLSV